MYALPAIGLGFLLHVGGRSRSMKSIGTIILGFGLLFLGIEYMKEAFRPLQRSTGCSRSSSRTAASPCSPSWSGWGMTMLIQSSSASIAIVQLLAMGGAFGTNWQVALDMAIPFVLGANIGTTITAQLAALQANRTARRAAWAHTMFNVLGTVIAYPCVLLGWYGSWWIS